MKFFYSKDNLVALHFKYDQARRRFIEWVQNEIAVVPEFHKRILFSDEAHFWLNGYVNKQNYRIWSEANPQVYEDKGPVVSRPYRYDRVKQGIIDYHIDKMLRDGTICPINSPYASPVVLTRKKNDLPPDSLDAYRFEIDYRKLNGITKYPRYPLPVIDDLLTNIPHTNVMSTLDLRSGYFQLAISPKDIKKQRLSLAMALLHSYACLLVFLGRRLISKGLSI
ncbi:retrovirus-related Pol polyprotein from transposon 297 [Trichonephila clavipes]|nr:retrovirus-related Pol polyprotein from transposon 297 [Trichonephila clavipes]